MTSRTTFPRRVWEAGLIAVLSSLLVGPSLAEENPTGYSVRWNNGLKIERNDGYHKLQLGGRALVDFAYIEQDRSLEAAKIGSGDGSGVKFRAARLYMLGTVYDHYFFKAQFDWAGGDTKLKDVFVGVKHLPVINQLMVGHFKEPFGLEQMTSLRFGSFMERSLAAVFTPARNVGLASNGQAFDQNLTWGVGVFRKTDNGGKGFSNSNDYNITGRLTGTPLYQNKGERLVHLGLSYSHKFRDARSATVAFATAAESSLGPKVVDTALLSNEGVDLLALEFAAVLGPWSIQSEYIIAAVQPASGDHAILTGVYAEATYFLTGEHRNYKRIRGAFGRVSPLQNWNPRGSGWGAWQLALRYSRLDLNDAFISGGEVQSATAGVNWHMAPNVRLMANYGFVDVDAAGKAHIFQMRAQVDF